MIFAEMLGKRLDKNRPSDAVMSLLRQSIFKYNGYHVVAVVTVAVFKESLLWSRLCDSRCFDSRYSARMPFAAVYLQIYVRYPLSMGWTERGGKKHV